MTVESPPEVERWDSTNLCEVAGGYVPERLYVCRSIVREDMWSHSDGPLDQHRACGGRNPSERMWRRRELTHCDA